MGLEWCLSHDTTVQEDMCRRLFTNFARGFFALTRLHIFCMLPQTLEAALLDCFSLHFPGLQRLNFRNYSLADILPDVPSLTNLLPSLSQLTHLSLHSEFLLPRLSDQLLMDIARCCPRITHINLSPSECEAELSSVGDIATALSHLSTIHLENWHNWRWTCRFSSSQLNTLLDQCPSLTHLHLPFPNELPPFAVDDVNAILAQHANIMKLTVVESVSGSTTPPYCSPHIRAITIHTQQFCGIQAVHKYIAHNPALTDVTVLMYDTAMFSCGQFADIKRRFPNIKRLVWQRDLLFRHSKQEARYVEGDGDPRVYRVFF